MNTFRLWAFISISVFTLSAQAHRPHEGKVFATVGPYFYQTQAVHAPDLKYAPPLVGAGLIAEGDLGDDGGAEGGMFYIDKTYQRTFQSGIVVMKTDKLIVPLGYRRWFGEKISGGVFLTSLFSVGDPRIIYSTVGYSDQTTGASVLVEYAADLSVQWEAWTNGTYSLLLDGRYSISLTPHSNEDANQFGLLIGIKYLIKEK